jgi:hypothetical protein
VTAQPAGNEPDASMDAASVGGNCRQVASRRRGAGGNRKHFSTCRIVAALTQ